MFALFGRMTGCRLKSNLKPIAAALGAIFAVSLAVDPVANAVDNPFGTAEMSNEKT